MRALILAIAAFFCTPAYADVAQCWPQQIGGSGTPASWRVFTSAGSRVWALWWHCRDAYSVVSTPMLTCSASLDTCVTQSVRDVLSGASAPTSTALSGLWGSQVKSAPPQWVVDAALASDPPASHAPQWFVAPNGTRLDRPAYPIIDGVRKTTSAARASAIPPSRCDCSVRSVEGKSVYCAHDAEKRTVALCRASTQ